MQTNKKTELGNGIDLAFEEYKELICEMTFNKEATREEFNRVVDYSISLMDCIQRSKENEINSLRNKYLKEKNMDLFRSTMQTNKKTELGNGIDLAFEEYKELICEMTFNKEATREEFNRVVDYSISLMDCIQRSKENEINSLRNKYLKEKNNAN